MKSFGTTREHFVDQAVNEAAHRLWSRRAFDPSKGDLESYFLSIARNVVRSQLRSEAIRGYTQLLPSDDLAQRVGGSPEPAPRPTPDLLADVMACVAHLSELQQKIVLADLRHRDAIVPARELAEQLGTTSNTIYVARNKAHKKLARLLEARGVSFT